MVGRGLSIYNHMVVYTTHAENGGVAR
jgi:hypothetical protein